MRIQTIEALLFFVLLGISIDAVPDCAPGLKCPPGGMWGEWAVQGNGVCKLECGSCSELFQTRTCLSEEIPGCECTGASSRYIPCNMQICQYPIQRACCIPYVPMIMNGTQMCGPLPKTMREPLTSCCPIGGIWSEYSKGYQRINNQWVRTRRCLSEANGCKCTGSETIGNDKCPCPAPSNAASTCPTIPNGRAHTFNNFHIQHDRCTAHINILNHNEGPIYCSSLKLSHKAYPWVAYLIIDEVDGGCTSDYGAACINVNGGNPRATFTCNTETLNWRYDFTGKDIKAYSQAVYINYIPL
ncbi:unnamed protein product [Caenorhabditis nigoni]